MPNYAKKSDYVERVARLLSEYNRVLLVECDNVGSAQMQHIRKALRGRAEMLMGKNVRDALRRRGRGARLTPAARRP